MPLTIRRDVDFSAGHCFEPRPADQGSPDVIVNNIPVVRLTDHYPKHCCGPVCHDGNASEGSPDVFANNLAVHRNGDAISCGDTAANGSPDVITNG